MVIFIGNCNKYQATQVNITTTMKKRLFIEPHASKTYYDIDITTTTTTTTTKNNRIIRLH